MKTRFLILVALAFLGVTAHAQEEEEAFELMQGTRVEIVDSIADKTSGKWLQVSTAGGHKAWLKAKDIEVI